MNTLDMKFFRCRRSTAAIVSVLFFAGCGAGAGGADSGADDAVADAAADTAVDVSGDAPDETARDSVTDSGRDSAADLSFDAAFDAVIDATPDIDESDSVSTDVSPDAFKWPSGCDSPGTGAAWTVIEDRTFKRGPMIQMSDRDTVTVVWRTAVRTDEEGCVDYEVGGETQTRCGTADKNGQYEIKLEGLPAATEVTYSARVGDSVTTDLTFRTMPGRAAPMKFAVFADAHLNVENMRKMTAVVLAEGVDFAVGVGDFVDWPYLSEFDTAFEGLQDLGSRVNIWAVLGNHDTGGMFFFDSFVLPKGNTIEPDYSNGYGEGWWDARIGNVWLGGGWQRDFYFAPMIGDPNYGEIGWFKQRFTMDHYKSAQWRLFFIHEPPYCWGWGGCDYDGEECLRDSLIPMAAENGIQATFHGHMHGIEYGEKDGVKMFISGGIGGELDYLCPQPPELPLPWAYNYVHHVTIVETGCESMTVRFVGLDGVEIDRVVVPYGD